MSSDQLLQSIDEAHGLADELGIGVLRGSEVDIHEDGSLDYPDEVLEQLDYTICSVHSMFKMDKEKMTERIMTAMSSGQMDVFGHPTGRLIGKREGYVFDIEKVMDCALKNKVCLEDQWVPGPFGP